MYVSGTHEGRRTPFRTVTLDTVGEQPTPGIDERLNSFVSGLSVLESH